MNHAELLLVAERRDRQATPAIKESLDAGDIDTSVIYTTPNALAKELGVSNSAINNLIGEGKVKAFKFGARVFIHPDQAELIGRLAKSGLIFRPESTKSG